MYDDDVAEGRWQRYAKWVADVGADPIDAFSTVEPGSRIMSVFGTRMSDDQRGCVEARCSFNPAIAAGHGWNVLGDGRLRCIYGDFLVSVETNIRIEYGQPFNIRDRAKAWLESVNQ